MNKKLLFSVVFALTVPLLYSCDDNDDDIDNNGKYQMPYKLYVLNEGCWNYNNASISAMDAGSNNGLITTDIYYSANGKALGDVAQDLIYDDDTHCLYVSVSESHYIAKLDDKGHELARYATTEEQDCPRSLILEDGYLYASLYGGMVAKFDTVSLSLIATVKTGTYPEQMAVEDELLAVCNSGWGNENTLTFIDLNSFSVVKTLELPHMNPQNIVSCNDRFYCNTTEYDENWNANSNIVEVNPKNWSVKDIAEGFYMTEGDDKVFIVKQEVNYMSMPYTYVNTFMTYDTKSGQLLNSFVSDVLPALAGNQGIYGITYDDDSQTMYMCICNQEGNDYVNSTVIFHNAKANISGEFSAGILAKKVVLAE